LWQQRHYCSFDDDLGVAVVTQTLLYLHLSAVWQVSQSQGYRGTSVREAFHQVTIWVMQRRQ
jgi:hypothetical protein